VSPEALTRLVTGTLNSRKFSPDANRVAGNSGDFLGRALPARGVAGGAPRRIDYARSGKICGLD
jgi:hypothetical protein